MVIKLLTYFFIRTLFSNLFASTATSSLALETSGGCGTFSLLLFPLLGETLLEGATVASGGMYWSGCTVANGGGPGGCIVLAGVKVGAKDEGREGGITV